MPGPIINREVAKFRTNPVSVRNAMALILIATVITVFASGFLVWVFDRRDFPDMGIALWWAIQTVTTVGYGDVTPTNTVGRLIGSAVLLYSVAFLTILTAAITTSFIDRSRIERQGEPSKGRTTYELLED